MTIPKTLLLAGQTREELRAKLATPAEPLASWWRHLQTLARQHPFWYSSYNVLTFVVNGDAISRQHARTMFLRFTAEKDAGLRSVEVQFHTHTASAPLARLLALYDWIADTDLLTPAEDAAFRAAAIDFATQASLEQLRGRGRMFDNQVFANAFGAAMVGFVLGVRRGNNAAARRLYALGMAWLEDQFHRLPRTGYSGEGSTYNQIVVIPCLTLAGVFFHEATGNDLYAHGLPSNPVPLRGWLQQSRDMIGPDGLQPGWDAHGVFHASVRAPLAYLARRERDPDTLALIRDAQMWYPFAHTAWDFDDRLWTLAWWPADLLPSPRYPYAPWLNRPTAGAIQDGQTGVRLFQYWDECGTPANNGRPNVNPNAIELVAGGLPLLLDGMTTLPPHLLNLDEAAITEYLPTKVLQGLRRLWQLPDTPEVRTRLLRHVVSGCLGDSNSLVLDGENWYFPKEARAGRGICLYAVGDLQVLVSEAKDYYRDRYDVMSVRRTSVLLRGRSVLCQDDFMALTPHRLSWQVFTWPGAETVGSGVRALAGGGEVQLDLVPGQAGNWELTPVPEFPKTPCHGSTRLQFHLPAPTKKTTLTMALVPQARLATLATLDDGWTVHGPAGETRAVNLATFYLDDPWPNDTPLAFTREVLVPAGHRGPLYFRLDSAVGSLQVALGEQVLAPLWEQDQPIENGCATTFPRVYPLGQHAPGTRLALRLTLRTFAGESLRGPATLLREQATAPVALHASGAAAWALTVGGESDEILLAHYSNRAQWQGGESDASFGHRGPSGNLALAEVTRADFPADGLRLKANLPVAVALVDGVLELAHLRENAQVVIHYRGARLVLSMNWLVEITAQCPTPLTFRLRQSVPRQLWVNGEARGVVGGPGEQVLTLTLPATPSQGPTPLPRDVEDLYRLADTPGSDFDAWLVRVLELPDWRLQMAAADLAGRFAVQAAVPRLLALLAEEEALGQPPPLKYSWTYSKMVQALAPDANKTPDQHANPELATRRWRLKRALVTALGLIGDPRAVAPLEAILRRANDFFPALSQVPIALARLGATSSVPILEELAEYGEVNVRVHVNLARPFLQGHITRAEFEERVNPA